MIKLVGALMTFIASGIIGLILAGLFEKRPRQLIALEGALQLLETEIVYAATPITEAVTLVAEKCDGDISELFRYTAHELNKNEGVTAGEAWNKSIDYFYQTTALNNQDMLILKRFGATLGASDRIDQQKHLELAKSQLETAAAQAEAVSKRNATIYKYMGFLCGLLIVLIIY